MVKAKKTLRRLIVLVTCMMFVFGTSVYADDPQKKTQKEEEKQEETTKSAGSVNDIKIEYETDENGNLILKNNLEDNNINSWNTIINKYHNQIIGVSGVCAVTFLVIFIYYFVQLAAGASNPQKRSAALIGILWTGIATALFGGVSIVMSITYYFLK